LISTTQSWESCRYSFRDGEIDVEEIERKYKDNIPRTRFSRRNPLENEKLNTHIRRLRHLLGVYFCCSHPEIFHIYPLHANCQDNEIISGACLYFLDMLEVLQSESNKVKSLRDLIDERIEDGLKMCQHCKFYEPNSDNLNTS
jgi:hypothetical protein